MEVELRHLRIISRIAEAGSITRAAAREGVSQPTMSTQLRRIESAFGGPLFKRGQEGIAPTALGRHVLARARGLLDDVDDLLTAARDNGTGIRLGTHPHFLIGEWMRCLATELAHRTVSTDLDHSCAALTQLLAADKLDVVLMGRAADRFAPPSPPGTTERVIAVEQCGVALPSTHPLAVRGRVRLADLAAESWLPPQGGDDGSIALLRAACGAEGFTPNFRDTTLDGASMIGFVVAGLAVALVSPTWQPPEGLTAVALAGRPVHCHRVLRWRDTAMTVREIDILHRTFHGLYKPVVQRHIATLPWLADNPDARPRIIECGAA